MEKTYHYNSRKVQTAINNHKGAYMSIYFQDGKILNEQFPAMSPEGNILGVPYSKGRKKLKPGKKSLLNKKSGDSKFYNK